MAQVFGPHVDEIFFHDTRRQKSAGAAVEWERLFQPEISWIGRDESLQFIACRFASKKLAYFGVDRVFRSGAPRPMKMGTIAST
jgi:hypothetical protein